MCSCAVCWEKRRKSRTEVCEGSIMIFVQRQLYNSGKCIINNKNSPKLLVLSENKKEIFKISNKRWHWQILKWKYSNHQKYMYMICSFIFSSLLNKKKILLELYVIFYYIIFTIKWSALYKSFEYFFKNTPIAVATFIIIWKVNYSHTHTQIAR